MLIYVSFCSLNTTVEGSPYLVAADAAEEVLAKSSSGGTSEPRSDASEYLLNLFLFGFRCLHGFVTSLVCLLFPTFLL